METYLNLLIGHEKVVDLLIRHGSDVDSQNNGQATPLHFAVSKGGYHFINIMNLIIELIKFVFH